MTKIVRYVDLRNISIYCAALWICLRNILAALICKFSTFFSPSKSILSKIGSWRQRQREGQKSNRCRFAKQQLCTCITLFCTFLCRHCTTTTWKCLISLFCREREHKRTTLFFLFLIFDTVLKNSTPEKLGNLIWQIEWGGISAKKFEAAGIHLLSNVFVAVAVLLLTLPNK